MFKEVNPSEIVLDHMFKGMCLRPFYKHPKGCPNYGKKHGCPPSKFLENEILDFKRPMYVIYTPFNISEFAKRMADAHPEWQEYPRQLCNPRRWQSTSRKNHRADISEFLKEHPYYHVDSSPEARGVNVSALMKSVGVDLRWDWPPKEILDLKNSPDVNVYTVSLAGYITNSHR